MNNRYIRIMRGGSLLHLPFRASSETAGGKTSSGKQQTSGEIGFLSFWIQDGADYQNKNQKKSNKMNKLEKHLKSYLEGYKRKAKLGLS